jgi:hypothetical protein
MPRAIIKIVESITEQIKAYRAGKITFVALVAWLLSYPFKVPERDRPENRPTDPGLLMAYIDEAPPYTPDTWDEVYRARATGLLTQEEIQEITKAWWAKDDAKASP